MTPTELAWLRLKAFEISMDYISYDKPLTLEQRLKVVDYLIEWALKPESEGKS